MDIISHWLSWYLAGKNILKNKEYIKLYSLFFTISALLPDIDAAWAWINYEVLHRVFSHSLIMAPLFALIFSYLFFLVTKKKLNFKKLYLIWLTWVCLHILLDSFLVWWVPLFWPISDTYFSLNIYTYIYEPWILPIVLTIFLTFITWLNKKTPQKVYLIMGIYFISMFIANIAIKSYIRMNLEEKPDLLVPYTNTWKDTFLHHRRKAIYIWDNEFNILYIAINWDNLKTTKQIYKWDNICAQMHNWYVFYEDGYLADVRYARKIVLSQQEEENCFFGIKK